MHVPIFGHKQHPPPPPPHTHIGACSGLAQGPQRMLTDKIHRVDGELGGGVRGSPRGNFLKLQVYSGKYVKINIKTGDKKNIVLGNRL